MQGAIEKIANSGSGLTIIIIAHRLTTIASADNLLFFQSRSELVTAEKGTAKYEEIFERLKSISYAQGQEDDNEEDEEEFDDEDQNQDLELDNDEDDRKLGGTIVSLNAEVEDSPGQYNSTLQQRSGSIRENQKGSYDDDLK